MGVNFSPPPIQKGADMNLDEIKTKWQSFANIKDVAEKREARLNFLYEIQKILATVDIKQQRMIMLTLFRQVHGLDYKYRFAKDKDIRLDDICLVICPIHGDNRVRMIDHILPPVERYFPIACKICTKSHGFTTLVTSAGFIAKSEQKYGDLYDHSLVEYAKNNEKVTLICKQCKDKNELIGNGTEPGVFSVKPYGYLFNERVFGCPRCARLSVSNRNVKGFEETVERLKKIHGDDFDFIEYVFVPAKGKSKKNKFRKLLKYTCNNCGAEGLQRVDALLAGHKCKHCSNHGYNLSNISRLMKFYVVRIYHKDDNSTCLYKIGVTSQEITRRLRKSFDSDVKYDIKLIREYRNGNKAFYLEQFVKEVLLGNEYSGNFKLKNAQSGKTELFNESSYQIILDRMKEFDSICGKCSKNQYECDKILEYIRGANERGGIQINQYPCFFYKRFKDVILTNAPMKLVVIELVNENDPLKMHNRIYKVGHTTTSASHFLSKETPIGYTSKVIYEKELIHGNRVFVIENIIANELINFKYFDEQHHEIFNNAYNRFSYTRLFEIIKRETSVNS